MEQGQHCPYLGLKHNRAIRFASPTPEHRCYVSGDPQEIPVDQSGFCLSPNHVRCPLYTGEMMPSMAMATPAGAVAVRPRGLRGWVASLSPRDRTIYGMLLTMLGVILVVYLVGAYLFFAKGETLSANPPTATLPVVEPASATPTLAPAPSATPSPSATLSTATSTVSPSPSTTPTEGPTQTPYVIIVTSTPSPFVEPPTPIIFPPTLEPTAEPTLEPTAEPTLEPTAEPSPTDEPAPSDTPEPAPSDTPEPPTEEPTLPPEPPGPELSALTLYFGDPSGRLLVPVLRSIPTTNRWRTTAVNQLLAGPGEGLSSPFPAGVQLLGLGVQGSLATVNLSRDPGSQLARDAIVLTLTERGDVLQVQFQVDGRSLGSPATRPILNIDNKDRFSDISYKSTTSDHLPLYFPLASAPYMVRLIRIGSEGMVATQTVDALIEGPRVHADLLFNPIPPGTTRNRIAISNGVATVDFNAVFAEASDRDAAVSALVLALTSFPTIQQVVITVDGQSLGDLWGGAYGGPLVRPSLNPE